MPKYINYDDNFIDDLESRFGLKDDRRSKKKKVNHTPKKHQGEIVAEIADPIGLEGGFNITYNPSRHEEGWLLKSLESFYFQDLITDVMAVVKGGKEASVYRCKASEITGKDWLAAKVYRPRQFRQIRNDSLYREGREVLGEDGKPLNERDWRAMKALNKGANFGQRLAHTSWLMHEYRTLQLLHSLGASVPEPIAASENALLMEYLGDDLLPAPTLSEVKLQDDEAEPLFREVMRNIHLMLRQGFIHGDLSAFNIMYSDGRVMLIDFPQIVNVYSNSNARAILHRDVTRVCEYFSQWLTLNPENITRQLWRSYGKPDQNQDELLFNLIATAERAEDDKEFDRD